MIIESGEKGFECNIEIPKINSDGKSKMVIFCFDLMMLEAFNSHVDFLIHDSNLAYDKCKNNENIQYIIALNSDIVSKQNLKFDMDKNVVLKLSDDCIENSLLGFEF